MTRPLRLEFPGALYHVTSRGNRRNPIFQDDADRRAWLNLLGRVCERHHFANRDQFLQLKQTYEELWANNIIPIANENDVVSNRELKFSDNDELATLIAVGFGAATLVLCTSVGGLLDGPRRVSG